MIGFVQEEMHSFADFFQLSHLTKGLVDILAQHPKCRVHVLCQPYENRRYRRTPQCRQIRSI